KSRSEGSRVVDRLACVLVCRAGLSPVMVGRNAELGQLLRLSDGLTGTPAGAAAGVPAAAGRAGVALVGGEPGVARTRLGSELTGTLAPAYRVLTGQADPDALGCPYHLLLDLVDGRHDGDTDTAVLVEQLADTGRSVEQRSAAGAALFARLCG